MFAAVVGNTVKTLAQYQVETGATIGRLGQLMGSQTVFGTLKSFFLLRPSFAWTAALISVWAFSPLGSQASSRVANLAPNVTKGIHTYYFQNPSFEYDVALTNLQMDNPHWKTGRAFVGVLYGASMFNPEAGMQYSNGTSPEFDNLNDRLGGTDVTSKITTQDMWGNVRIPDPTSLSSYSESKMAEGFDVPYQSQVIDYVSLIGVPVQGITSNFTGNTSFTIRANYQGFNVGQVGSSLRRSEF